MCVFKVFRDLAEILNTRAVAAFHAPFPTWALLQQYSHQTEMSAATFTFKVKAEQMPVCR